MKKELNLTKEKIKKDKLWLIILFSLLIINFIYYYLEYSDFKINNEYFLELISCPLSNNTTELSILFNIYFICYIVYYSLSYYNYELENLKEYMIIRDKSKKWFISKIISIFAYIIILKILLMLLIGIFSSFRYSININYYMITFLYLITISIISITLNNIIKNNTLVTIISIILSCILFFKIKNITITLILFLVLLIFNIIFFSFKKIYKLKDY